MLQNDRPHHGNHKEHGRIQVALPHEGATRRHKRDEQAGSGNGGTCALCSMATIYMHAWRITDQTKHDSMATLIDMQVDFKCKFSLSVAQWVEHQISDVAY